MMERVIPQIMIHSNNEYVTRMPQPQEIKNVVTILMSSLL